MRITDANVPPLTEHPSAIPYADGSEELLLGIVTQKNFSEKRTWLSYQNDWALYYHLSPLRKNILTALEWGEKPLDVLELGAGCGAVTSGLVTYPNLNVEALEGSLARAKVIQGRCRGFENIAIHVCDINKYSPEKKYDVVTLIGVLEYAGRYSDDPEPFHALLKNARSLLKTDGVLLLAIENKLGSKYMNGSYEDHYFSCWEGINDYPNYKGIRTFEKETLKQMLSECGFAEQKWLYPYPDYKLPSVVLSDTGVKNQDFEWVDLFRITEREQNMAEKPYFDEFTFFNSLKKEGCAESFMNSFLIVAGSDKESIDSMVPQSLLGYRSNGKCRLPQYTVNSYFHETAEGVEIARKKEKESVGESQYIHQVIDTKPEEYYKNHTNIEAELKRVLQLADCDVPVFSLLDLWVSQLTTNIVEPTADDTTAFKSFCNDLIGTPLYQSEYSNAEWLDGSFIDVIPSNILISRENNYSDSIHIIDQEWQFKTKIPLQFVFDRGVIIMNQRIPELMPYLEKKFQDNPALLNSGIGYLFSHKSVTEVSQFEQWFQSSVFYSDFTVSLPEQHKVRLKNDVGYFFATVTDYVEKQQFQEAITVYNIYRENYFSTPEIAKYDQLIEQLKGQLSNFS